MGSAGAAAVDPLFTLREYRELAPWRLRDLSTVAGALLEASGIRPINAAAATRPTERTIRFYVTRGLVTPPDGRGTAATYGYRHLLQVLLIKLRQMEGATLETIRDEIQSQTGDVLERRIAAALGSAVPTPGLLPLLARDEPARGRAGQLLHVRLAGAEVVESTTSNWKRLEIADGLELHIQRDHPLTHIDVADREIADALRLAVLRLMASASDPVVHRETTPESGGSTHT